LMYRKHGPGRGDDKGTTGCANGTERSKLIFLLKNQPARVKGGCEHISCRSMKRVFDYSSRVCPSTLLLIRTGGGAGAELGCVATKQQNRSVLASFQIIFE
jgi:hypothetical protein